jgi:Flp pilus assembly protein TadD
LKAVSESPIPSEPLQPTKAAASSHPWLEARVRLEEAERLRCASQLDRARAICEALLKRYPDYVGALHTLGLVLADQREYAGAMASLNHAAMLNPKDWRTLTALSGVYLRLNAPQMAARTLEQALKLNPDDASVLVTLGEIYREEREYELAADAFRKANTLDPSLDMAQHGLASSCTHLGRLSEAANILSGLVQRGSRRIGTLLALAQLPGSMVKIDLLPLLAEAVPGKNASKEEFESLAAFARAAAFDKMGRYAEAWDNLVAANRPHFREHQDAYQKDSRRQAAFLAWLRNCPIDAKPAGADESGYPLSLFILGPSRSGKTTMEKLVSSLDGVKRGYENPIVENAARRAFQTAGFITRDLMIEMPPALDKMCRDFYFEELAERAGSAKVFTNTHPGRIFDVARLAAILPTARFVFIKRDVDDLTLRIYMRKYLAGNAYGYDVGTICDYIAWYHQTIDVLTEKLPGIARTIRYEDMIADPAAALGSVAGLCGMPAPADPSPELGDDRGCAEPYRGFIAQALEG